MAETAVDFLSESLSQIRKGETDCPFSAVEMNQIGCLYEEVESLRTCLKDLENNRIKHEEIEDVMKQIRDVAYEAADIIDLSLVDHISKKKRSQADKFVRVHVLYLLRNLSNDLKEIKSAEKEVMEICEKKICAIGDSQQRRKREMAEAAIDSLLEKLNQLIEGEIYCPFSLAEMLQIARLYEELQSPGTCLKDLEKNHVDHLKVQSLLTRISDTADEAADIIKYSSVNHVLYPRRTLSVVLKEIKSIKKQVMEIYQKKLYGIRDTQVGLYVHQSSSRATSALNVEEETVIGFDHEVEMLKERLTGIQKQLEVISIVGMAGLGKTTLARKLYNDPFIVYHFYIRGWTYVSQVYQKKDLLLNILSSVVGQNKTQIHTLRDEQLGEELYKSLKGKRYLIVMDDMWHIGSWNDLKRYFPNDNNGSRILFTSQLTDFALHSKHDSPPHHLCFLNEDDSWDLLQKKIFLEKSCPLELTDIGKQIAKKCHGLPLAIVVVAGLLAKMDKNPDWWKQVAGNLSSYIARDTEHYMDILALSYNNLPCHLKSCFLHLGVFYYEISVKNLIWLWIAEGFIHRIGHESKRLEDMAEDYLMDLIDRNLVLVVKRRSTGGIKACRVHDLLHDLCLKKAKEENFLQQISSSSSSSFSSSSLVPTGKKHRRLCIYSHAFSSKPFAPHIRSIFYFVGLLPPESMSHICFTFILLRVLDLSAINILSFPSEIVQLFLLRYLALQGRHMKIPTSIGNLQNLEFLIIPRIKGFIPNELWNIVTLRHLSVAGKNYIQAAPTEYGFSFVLYNLQTISHISPTRPCQDLLARTPNLRKLGFCGYFDPNSYGNFWFPDLDFLNYLENLKLINLFVPYHYKYNLQAIKFPPNLRRLTLSNTGLEWKEMSVLGMLPNLEVLKLKDQACIGSLWETSDGGFRRLKYLRFYYMDLEQWNASSIHFPSLQHLVLHNCLQLKEIPSELGDICTLQTIEVRSCNDSAINSVREIQKEQEGIGNDSLKIII